MTQSVDRAHTLPVSGSFIGPDDGGHPWPRGTTLPGQYVIERVLGQGGFAVVYEAMHPDLGLVAVKVLDRSQANGEATEDRFFREAEIAASVDHPNVLRVHELGRAHDGSPFLVMELLRGEDLSDLIERQRLDVAATVEIGIQLTQALEALWAAGVVHRDLKPHNVLLHESEGVLRPKLIDFGIATSTEDSAVTKVQKLTATGVILGTPHYLPPEQARGEALDVRADLYALGVVLYEAHCGRAPFEEGNLNALIASVLRDDRPRITEFAPDCPEALADILAKALEREREDRYQTPGELLAALDEFAREARLPRGGAALAGLKVSKTMTLPWELRNLAPCERSGRPIPVPIRVGAEKAAPMPSAGKKIAPKERSEGRWDPRATETWRPNRPSDLTPRPVTGGPPRPKARIRAHLAPLAAVAGVVLGAGLAGLIGGHEGPRAAHAAATRPEGAIVGPRKLEGGDAREAARSARVDEATEPAAATAPAREADRSDQASPKPETEEAGAQPGPDEAQPETEEAEEPKTADEPAPATRRRARRPQATNVGALERMAHQAYIRGRLGRARILYLRAARSAPDAAGAWRGYGLVAAQMGRKSEARHALGRYLRLAPNAADAAAVRRQLAQLR